MELLKQQSINKLTLINSLRDFIDDSRQNIENKSNSINLILQAMKEENEQFISKSMNKNINNIYYI